MANDSSTDYSVVNPDSETIDTGTAWSHVAVPNYLLDSPADYASDTVYATGATYSSTGTTGSSFLRLGSFPDVETPSSYADISGFANSLALVQLVGSLETIDDTNYGKVDSTTVGAWGVFHSTPRVGDTDYSLVGFVDDTRSRPDSLDFSGTSTTEQQYVDNSTSQENSTLNRQEETRRLLYKGGWWDHTDGNRIVTTGGDKIEIIQGNYKLAVLGRQNPSDSDHAMDMASVTDVSGGLDAGVTYEWLPSEDMWAVYDSSSAKYAYKETQGVDVSVFTGTKKVVLIGSETGDATTNPETVSKSYASQTEAYTGSVIDWVKESYSLGYTDERREFSTILMSTSVKFIAESASVAVSRVSFLEAKIYTHSLAVVFAPVTLSLIGAPITYDIKWGNEWSYSTVEKIELFGSVKVEPALAVLEFFESKINKVKARFAKTKQETSAIDATVNNLNVDAIGAENDLNAATLVVS